MRQRVLNLAAYIIAASPIAILGAAIFAGFGEQPTRWAAEAQRSEWLGFVGGIIGGVMTLAAAGIAFGVTRQQVDIQAAELGELRDEKIARAHMVRVMLAAAVGRVIADAELNIEKCKDRTEVAVSSLRDISTIKRSMTYEELWRVDDEIAKRVILLDLASESFNSRVGEARPYPGIRTPIGHVVVDMEPVRDKAVQLAALLAAAG